MTTNDTLTTTATRVETILTHHSVTYTTTDNRGKEEGDYRITVGDVTAYLTASDDGNVWATTDENPADANVSYWDGYWEVEDSHTTIEVDTDGDWDVTQSDVDGIDWRGCKGEDVAAVFRAGALAYEQPIAALASEAITTFIAEGRMVTYCLSADIYPALFWEIVEKHARHAVDPQLGRTVSH